MGTGSARQLVRYLAQHCTTDENKGESMTEKIDSKDVPQLKLNVNRKEYTVAVQPDTPLLWVIRENLGLTGTK